MGSIPDPRISGANNALGIVLHKAPHELLLPILCKSLNMFWRRELEKICLKGVSPGAAKMCASPWESSWGPPQFHASKWHSCNRNSDRYELPTLKSPKITLPFYANWVGSLRASSQEVLFLPKKGKGVDQGNLQFPTYNKNNGHDMLSTALCRELLYFTLTWVP